MRMRMRMDVNAPGWYLGGAYLWAGLAVVALFLDDVDAMPFVLAALICSAMWRVARVEQLLRTERRERERSDVSG